MRRQTAGLNSQNQSLPIFCFNQLKLDMEAIRSWLMMNLFFVQKQSQKSRKCWIFFFLQEWPVCFVSQQMHYVTTTPQMISAFIHIIHMPVSTQTSEEWIQSVWLLFFFLKKGERKAKRTKRRKSAAKKMTQRQHPVRQSAAILGNTTDKIKIIGRRGDKGWRTRSCSR